MQHMTTNAEILRSIKTLKSIHGKPAAEFWKEVEAAQKTSTSSDEVRESD